MKKIGETRILRRQNNKKLLKLLICLFFGKCQPKYDVCLGDIFSFILLVDNKNRAKIKYNINSNFSLWQIKKASYSVWFLKNYHSSGIYLVKSRNLYFSQMMNRRTVDRLTSAASTQVPSVVEAPTYLDTIKSRDNLVRNFPDLDPSLQTRNLGIRSGLTPSSGLTSRRSSGYSVR